MTDAKDLLGGVNPILEKLKTTPSEIAEIILAEGSQRPALRGIESEARRQGVRLTYRSPQTIDQMARGLRHQGVLARVKAFLYFPFSELEQSIKAYRGAHWILILDGLTDPRNVGALLRTAEAVGVRHILIPQNRSVGVTPTVAKASAGAINHLRICCVTNLRRAIVALKNSGFWIVGLDAQSPAEIYSTNYPERLGIVLGSEGYGIRPLIRQECDFLVSIPMCGKIASLNVSVAGAVFLYELLRQTRSIDKGGG